MRTATCPRCGSVDVFSSRARGGFETALRAVGIPARRCSACGWRGLRLRVLSPVAQKATRHSSASSAEPSAPAPVGGGAVSRAGLPSASGVRSAADSTQRASKHRRHHHHRHRVRSKRRNALRALGLALVLGLATGAVAQRCGEQQVSAEVE